MEIKSISQKIFRTNLESVENKSNHTNPFGVNFKGKMIKMDALKDADVFESAAKSKLSASTFVGSIGSAISHRLNSVVDFGKKLGENVSKLWSEAKEYKIELGSPELRERVSLIRDRISSLRKYSDSSLDAKGTSELKVMLTDAIATPVAA
jgi:hypothetical protein